MPPSPPRPSPAARHAGATASADELLRAINGDDKEGDANADELDVALRAPADGGVPARAAPPRLRPLSSLRASEHWRELRTAREQSKLHAALRLAERARTKEEEDAAAEQRDGQRDEQRDEHADVHTLHRLTKLAEQACRLSGSWHERVQLLRFADKAERLLAQISSSKERGERAASKSFSRDLSEVVKTVVLLVATPPLEGQLGAAALLSRLARAPVGARLIVRHGGVGPLMALWDGGTRELRPSPHTGEKRQESDEGDTCEKVDPCGSCDREMLDALWDGIDGDDTDENKKEADEADVSADEAPFSREPSSASSRGMGFSSLVSSMVGPREREARGEGAGARDGTRHAFSAPPPPPPPPPGASPWVGGEGGGEASGEASHCASLDAGQWESLIPLASLRADAAAHAEHDAHAQQQPPRSPPSTLTPSPPCSPPPSPPLSTTKAAQIYRY